MKLDLARPVVEARLAAWQEAGLIDAETAGRIRAFERRGALPFLPATLVVLGAFAIALGLVAIVSANWGEIPVWLKLGTHIAANIVLGTLCWRWWSTGGGRWTEAGLLVLSASTLALIGHVGQSFQLQGELSGALGLWLALVTPFTLWMARAGLHRTLWTLGMAVWLGALAEQHWDWLEAQRLLGAGFFLLLAATYALRLSPLHPRWREHFHGLGLALILAAPTVALIGLFDDVARDPAAIAEAMVAVPVGTLAILAAHFAGPAERRDGGRVMGLLLAASPLLTFVPVLAAETGLATVLTAALFAGYWLLLAREALRTDHPALYNLAVGMIALRGFIVFLQAAGGLLATGFGLILGGLVVIALGAVARRFMVRTGGDKP